MNTNKEVIKVIAAFAIVLTSGGCAQLKPAAVHLETEHTSHMSQHQPFTDHPSNTGYDTASVGLLWRPVKNMTLIIEDGYAYHTKLDAMREVFQVSISYDIPLR
jgi:hypothetical protein